MHFSLDSICQRIYESRNPHSFGDELEMCSPVFWHLEITKYTSKNITTSALLYRIWWHS